VAPVVALAGLLTLFLLWVVTDPREYLRWFSMGEIVTPVEWMTLPLFALIVPLTWLCPPNAGSSRRQCAWAFVWSLLAVLAIVRETDLHKVLFAQIWPEVASTFRGTVFKMPFLRAETMPLAAKLFVLAYFVLHFAIVILPLVRFAVPLVKGVLRFAPVAWSAATFGGVSLFVLLVDHLPASLRDWGIVNLKTTGHEAGLALCKGMEEGAEMLMAILALLVIVQAHLLFGQARKGD